jgi:putative ABC transport system ATP-binding protein
MSSFIQARNLSKRFRKGDTDIVPLQDLDLEVEPGTFLALMGPSGSGKTTLLNLLAGIDRPSSGELIINDRPIHAMRRGELTAWRAATVGYIFQLYHLIPVLTAFENVELPLLLKPLARAERQQRVSAALALVGLSDRSDHFPHQLSGGQEQRVAIARALIADPALLVADEPTGDLDAEAAAAILELLKRLSREHGKTIVMVTHDPRAAAAADRCLHLDKGRLMNEEQVAS